MVCISSLQGDHIGVRSSFNWVILAIIFGSKFIMDRASSSLNSVHCSLQGIFPRLYFKSDAHGRTGPSEVRFLHIQFPRTYSRIIGCPECKHKNDQQCRCLKYSSSHRSPSWEWDCFNQRRKLFSCWFVNGKVFSTMTAHTLLFLKRSVGAFRSKHGMPDGWHQSLTRFVGSG